MVNVADNAGWVNKERARTTVPRWLLHLLGGDSWQLPSCQLKVRGSSGRSKANPHRCQRFSDSSHHSRNQRHTPAQQHHTHLCTELSGH